MQDIFLKHVDRQSQAALLSGDLLPVQAQELQVQEQGLVFKVRWVSNLAVKDASKVSIPGGPRDPNFNPFLPPDPKLTVGDYFATHNTVLNKFALSPQHLVLAGKEFSEQLTPLTLDDFTVLAQVLDACGGLGFYNGGLAGGASQRHKHVQWIPEQEGNPSLALYQAGLPDWPQAGEYYTHDSLAFEHVFSGLPKAEQGQSPQDLALQLLETYQTACQALRLLPDQQGLMPAHNMLMGQGWMLLVPRSQEMAAGISINALSFGGCIYVREPEQLEQVRLQGPLEILAQTGFRL